MKKLVSILLLTVSLAALSTTGYAAGEKVISGPLHGVQLKHNRLVIDDQTRALASGYIVKNSKGEIVSAFSLKRGQFVEYKLNEDRKITEIVIVR